MSALPPYPDGLLYPGASVHPTEAPPYTSTVPNDELLPSYSFFPSATATRRTIVFGYNDRETIGRPRPSLHPRAKLLPGSHDDIPVVYSRIHYPGAAVLPSRSLLPFFEGATLPTSYVGMRAVLNYGLRFTPSSPSYGRKAVARLVLALRFHAIGVLASESDRKMRTVVEIGTFQSAAEMTLFGGPLDLQSIDAPLEIA